MSTAIDGSWFEQIRCGECGITFHAPLEWVECRRDQGDHDACFYCPNGHMRIWKEPKIDKITRERDRAVQELARLAGEAREANARADKAERSKQRLQKRVSSGVCPCCQRSFHNVARHMSTQHPEFAKPKAVA